MVPLPLFKLGSLFLRHISKYGAVGYVDQTPGVALNPASPPTEDTIADADDGDGQNHIKKQAHDHARFRAFAARYGQMMHQLNMRMSVALLRDPEAERRAKEKAEAPTVKTEAQTRREDEAKAREEEKAAKTKSTAPTTGPTTTTRQRQRRQPFQNIWTRKFRALPEDKAVDLFADVVGDTFILGVAVALILYEYWRAQQKPDSNKERIEELTRRLEEREEAEEGRRRRLEELEQAVAALRGGGGESGKKQAPEPGPVRSVPEAAATA
ncbi:OPA3 domain protein [Cordyceps fumosorosea ARSEF 2679]|uniref:OPA3 domain protein n=1 Tax=Cordyceps fumosorosea (strain ARSEF 2679) TaxID=1081104 RepID=A0A167WLN3_CORFA|nr:OPA3 domain protein [Cordyceps fumosorosea ARSEF 2679]OAA63945.1 OPA3 domain protein [Cordyceps fumosorosea ARSEF 2679]